MALWSRNKRVRPSARDRDLDVVLDRSAPDGSAPPQLETLFDADDYQDEFEGLEGAEDAPVAEPAFELDAGPTSQAAPGPGRPTPRAEPVDRVAANDPPAPDSESEAVNDAGAPELREGSDDAPRSGGTHARRRAHGRAWHSRSSRARTEAATVSPAVDAGSADGDATVTDLAPRRSRFARARAAIPVAGKRFVSVGLIIVVLLAAVASLPLIATGINWLARWNKLRTAAPAISATAAEQDNLLVIGVSDGVVVGFAALKAERSTSKVLGIAIPDGAFVEVPGQGFERVGASYLRGPQVSEDAISNFFGVPFRRHVVVDGTAYQELLRTQDVTALMRSVTETDLTGDERASLTAYFGSVAVNDVWIVPLPVKPVAVGDQRYFEPQKAEIADLLLKWWGVQASQAQAAPRVIVYNGVGTPGLAGVAAQQLIRDGFKIVDSGNAPNFDYTTTEIHLFHGTQADADAVRASLGVGRVIVESAPQELTDMIVIVGTDYRPPTTDTSTVPTEGVQ